MSGVAGILATNVQVTRASVLSSTGPAGQAAYTTPGTYTWTAPAGVTAVSVVAIGGGSSGKFGGATYNGLYSNAGGGGGLGWRNCISVTPGVGYTVVVGAGGVPSGQMYYGGIAGADSYFINATTVKGGGAPAALNGPVNSPGGRYVGDGGGYGGTGGFEDADYQTSGGGGAGGYSGNGGYGGPNGVPGGAGEGGGGGGGSGGVTGTGGSPGAGGGGTGIFGQGSNGTRGYNAGAGGGGGSGGTAGGGAGDTNRNGGLYGGGGASQTHAGGDGAVRIIWGGGRSFPNNAANV